MGFEGREHLLDPDAVARDINPSDPSAAAIEAGRQVSMRIRDYLLRGTSFAVETTLSGRSIMTLMADVKRRYARSLANLVEAIRLADTARLYDNSGDEHRVILLAKAGVVMWKTSPLPRWAEFLSILEQNK